MAEGCDVEERKSAAVAAAYLRFAEEEARDRSALYEELARGMAGDPALIARLLTLRLEKRQPNLLLAAARHRFGSLAGWRGFRAAVMDDWDGLAAVMLSRSTQTNEPARCATLLPLLARLPQPLALLEVGASAGLCLLPDRYAYDYGGRVLRPAAADGPEPPVFPCATDAATPVPAALPRVVWRAGLDLHPLDLADPGDAAWLEALVWPERTDRLARLRAAMAVAAAHRPRLVRGDLRRDLAALAAEAPRDAMLVVLHTAVLAYVPSPEDRRAFACDAMALGGCWIANEAPRALDGIADGMPGPHPKGRFPLAANGTPVAWTDPHGASMAWIGDGGARAT